MCALDPVQVRSNATQCSTKHTIQAQAKRLAHHVSVTIRHVSGTIHPESVTMYHHALDNAGGRPRDWLWKPDVARDTRPRYSHRPCSPGVCRSTHPRSAPLTWIMQLLRERAFAVWVPQQSVRDVLRQSREDA